jgi:hypothetical protein
VPSSSAASGSRKLRASPGRFLTPSPILDTYWRFAVNRQQLFLSRLQGAPPPWTDDPILARHRFTNVYRAADRVSQYLIKNVIYGGDQEPDEVFFRTLLFKFFNKIETWEKLQGVFGTPEWRTFVYEDYASVLDQALSSGTRVYSAAYIVPSPAFGSPRKHRNHLSLLAHMMRDGAPEKVVGARSLQEVFTTLRQYPSLGDFLAFQFTIDLNYSDILHFSEMDYVVAGPGARDGISKCFLDTGGLTDADVIRVITDLAAAEFDRLGLRFPTLWGRDLQLIDCQNLFCEVGKYARASHPEVVGSTGRTRIKQRFTRNTAALPQWYPPKWKVEVPDNLRPEPRPPDATWQASMLPTFSVQAAGTR